MRDKGLIIMGYMLILALAVGLVSVFALPRILWNRLATTPLDVWIVDKTVPTTDSRGHKGVMWVLNSMKVVSKETGQPFDYDTDYYGIHPTAGGEFDARQLPSGGDKPDLIYLADTYGIYDRDLNLLHGGLSEDEMAVIRSSLGGGNTIIGEFSVALAPTRPDARKVLEDVFRMSWSLWSGSYFRELAKGVDVPDRIVRDYEKYTGETWRFSGEGFVLSSDDSQVIVLRKGKEVGDRALTLSIEPAYQEEMGITGSVPFENWFEFTQPDASAEVLATYTLDLTADGKAVLDGLGLDATFPAVIRSANTQYTSYYFAGDFAATDFDGGWWDYPGFAAMKRELTMGSKGDNSDFFWKCYVPMLGQIVEDVRSVALSGGDGDDGGTAGELQYASRTSGRAFQVMRDGRWEDFFVQGVNIGSSIPGRWFVQFPDDEAMYLDWFDSIAKMNANSIRAYTLLSPQFYTALAHHNSSRPEDALWLYQELWPDEEPEEGDYLKPEYVAAFEAEMRNTVDAVHGRANIPKRKERAYGIYTADVSPYIAGYLVGRELEPREVIATDEINARFTYEGEYLGSGAGASPTESWLAMCCDYVVSYEEKNYGWQHPVGIVSWPTLDPLEHDSEWNASGDKSLEYNDKASIDINHIVASDALKAGFFGAYHIYPNYPDFMNNEGSYAAYTDDEGTFRYGGYLQEFMKGHSKYPALVAEFGLATGMGNAHANPDGYNHGGLTEQQQGQGIVRMMKAIHREGYAGGIIFEWADEWAKKTWTTEPFMIPFDRNPLWHNAADPEQNYGILAMEAGPKRNAPYHLEGDGLLEGMTLSIDESYLYIDLDLSRPPDFSAEKLIVGLDTYARYQGGYMYSPGIAIKAPTGLEFVLEIAGWDDARLLVHPGYNTAAGRYSSYTSSDGFFEEMSLLVNKERVTRGGIKISAIYEDLSALKRGPLEQNSHNHWTVEGDGISIRIPWTRLNFSDPSAMRVLDDERNIPVPLTDQLRTVISEGILASALLIDSGDNEVISSAGLANRIPMAWDRWDVPTYRERLKTSYDIVKQYFGSDGSTAPNQ